jgi:spore coat polysaccharide biosynthesis predicted glycosyltransferase SpsG
MKDIMITLGDKYINVVDKVADILSNDGLIVNTIYPFGVIKGQANDDIISVLQNHEEVQNVQVQKNKDIAPPDSEIQ